MVYGFADGTGLVVQPDFEVTYPNDKRVTEAVVRYPLGSEHLVLDEKGRAITHLAYETTSALAIFAATTADGETLLTARVGKELPLG